VNQIPKFIKRTVPVIMKRYGIFVGFIIILIVVAILDWAFFESNTGFFTSANLLNIVRQNADLGVMAVGMTFVILTAGIDLSVGSLLALTGMFCATFEHQGWPISLIVLATLSIGAAIGLLNGLVITKGKVTPFVVTLGTMSIARGFAHIYKGPEPISGFGQTFRYIGRNDLFATPVLILIFLAAVLISAFILRYTRLGRYTYATGSNERAARLAGVNTDRIKIAAYTFSGLTAALAAIMLTSRLNAAETTAGQGYELSVIAAVVIGGTSLMGGRGGVWGTLIGVLLIGTINNAMNLLLISSYWQLVVRGAIIVAAVLLDRLREH